MRTDSAGNARMAPPGASAAGLTYDGHDSRAATPLNNASSITTAQPVLRLQSYAGALKSPLRCRLPRLTAAPNAANNPADEIGRMVEACDAA